MKIGPADDIADRARRAVWESEQARCIPVRWTFGWQVWSRLRREASMVVVADPKAEDSFLGLPFVVKESAPPDLLALDEF